ncbi:hypothetical protein SH661x_002810 [Planctomicrobium sp. SH661]|uniref:hypothetical protein n=1 Tax=Planctomicrobium sp. SH661 TaxID=3448124 RepID=UPI003F5BBECF
MLRLGAIPAIDLREIDDGSIVKVAGKILLRQRPGTAKGITFMNMEDEAVQVNLVVWHSTWE